jgi:hypothetical protein
VSGPKTSRFERLTLSKDPGFAGGYLLRRWLRSWRIRCGRLPPTYIPRDATSHRTLTDGEDHREFGPANRVPITDGDSPRPALGVRAGALEQPAPARPPAVSQPSAYCRQHSLTVPERTSSPRP